MYYIDIFVYFIDMALPWYQLDFSIEGAAIMARQPDFHWDHHGADQRSFVFWLITDGQGTLIAGDSRFLLHPGDCIISPLSLDHHGRHDPSNRLVIPWVRFHFISKTGRQIIPENPPSHYRRVNSIGFLNDLLKRSIDAFERRQAQSAHAWLRALFLEIAAIDQKNDAMKGQTNERHIAVKSIIESIRSDPGARWRISDLSQRLKITPDHFIRLFTAVTGITPGEFIINTRLDAAGNLLQMSGRSIGDIAADLGFFDSRHFCRLFTARRGMTPSAFRKR